jgi:hypothetical protein
MRSLPSGAVALEGEEDDRAGFGILADWLEERNDPRVRAWWAERHLGEWPGEARGDRPRRRFGRRLMPGTELTPPLVKAAESGWLKLVKGDPWLDLPGLRRFLVPANGASPRS